MRVTALVLGAALAALPLISASAFSVAAGAVQARTAALVRVAGASCPAGTHWANAGYVRGGKWREAHCANNNGKD